MKIDVAATPREFTDGDSAAAVVVIDVFRASTTITTALANGARFILPSADVEQAMKLVEPYAAEEALLGGERNCQKIEGFHLGNSPREYAREVVANKVIIFTTSNGTNALLAAKNAPRVVVGCFLNVAAVTAELANEPAVTLVCAGNGGRLCLEDFTCAGGFVARLAGAADEISDSAIAARAVYGAAGTRLKSALLATEHARRLIDLGFRSDIDFSLRPDSVPVVPQFHDGRIDLPVP